MKLPLEQIYYFPDLKFKEGKRKQFEEILETLFSYYEQNGDKVIDFLAYYYDKECQKQSVILAKKIKMKNEDVKNFQIDEKEMIELITKK